MRRGMSKTRGLQLRHYASRFIDLNKYLECFPGSTLYGKTGVTELKIILLNSMPNGYSNQAYVQGFDCGSISFKKLLSFLREFILLDLFMKVY